MSGEIKLSAPETREFWKVQILFQDEYLLALDKPARLLTSPDRYDPTRPNLMKLLHRDIERRAAWAVENNVSYLANAHRLDFETSGVLLLAKTKPALVKLADQFGSEQVAKEYLALVQGVPPEDSFTVEARLAPHPTRPAYIRVDEKNGKRSRTDFEVMERFSRFSLLRCRPLTGRTHQIRVHAKVKGFPIVADPLYGGSPLLLSSLKKNYRLKGGKTELPLIGRLALHAEKLSVLHPILETPINITAPIPHDLTVALKYLRRYALAFSPVREQPDETDSEEHSQD